MTIYLELEKIIAGSTEVKIENASPVLALEVQNLLKKKGFYIGDIDGIPGTQTLEAFAQFKKRYYLAHSNLLGASTAASLIEIGEEHTAKPEQSTPVNLADRRESMRLPTGLLVYNTDLIIPGGNLTWGEVTANCSRIPDTKELEENLLATARYFQAIRDVYGSPIDISSGFRPESVNRAIGGARFSQHVKALALDLIPRDGGLTKLLNVVLQSKTVGVGDGRKKGFIHADYRKNSPRVVFDY